ncbi:hypothetical protein [Alicyclobacillus suci]|uniref:hypothetical protein n=1 Tax=Alicyclobacillus suci TaxID=2816080 RepID=UPI001A900FE2|nr:hypothetical protein [Alicyclobacillus suci]
MDGSSQILNVTLNDFAEIAKALSSDLRIEMFDIPPSTASANVRKSEEVGLIQTELVLGTRGTQKCCAAVLNRMIVETQEPEEREENCVITSMPIGHFFDFEVTPTCGLLRRWQVSSHGSFIEGCKISDVVLRELR